MTLSLYRTGDMEGALAAMTRRNHHVVALADYRVKKLIKLRGRSPKLEGAPMLYVMGWKPEAHGIIERWQNEGGALIYRPLPQCAPTHPASDALMFLETPLQYDRMEERIVTARQEVVFYRPPTWDLHEDAIEHVWPRRHHYETLEAVLASLVGRELTPQMQCVRELMPHWSKFAIFTDDDMAAITGWDTRMLRAVLRFKYRKASVRLPVFKLRYVATHHDIKWAYEVLAAQPAIGKKLHVLRNDHPFEGQRPAFRSALRMLVRLNYVTREGCYYMVNMDHPRLNLDKIDAIHNMHRGKWFRVREFVNGLQEYPT